MYVQPNYNKKDQILIYYYVQKLALKKNIFEDSVISPLRVRCGLLLQCIIGRIIYIFYYFIFIIVYLFVVLFIFGTGPLYALWPVKVSDFGRIRVVLERTPKQTRWVGHVFFCWL